jgi:hypothetical protein
MNNFGSPNNPKEFTVKVDPTRVMESKLERATSIQASYSKA